MSETVAAVQTKKILRRDGSLSRGLAGAPASSSSWSARTFRCSGCSGCSGFCSVRSVSRLATNPATLRVLSERVLHFSATAPCVSTTLVTTPYARARLLCCVPCTTFSEAATVVQALNVNEAFNCHHASHMGPSTMTRFLEAHSTRPTVVWAPCTEQNPFIKYPELGAYKAQSQDDATECPLLGPCTSIGQVGQFG